MTETAPLLENYRWTQSGYQPLVFSAGSAGWQVALLNWEPAIDLAHLGEIERHVQTDEVFGLWRGQAALFVKAGPQVQLVDMQPGTIYNVPAGVWHNLVATRDVTLWIVENRDTHLNDTELRPMDDLEIAQVRAQLPDWAVPRQEHLTGELARTLLGR